MHAMQAGKFFTTSTVSPSGIHDATGDPICGLLCEEDSVQGRSVEDMVEAGTDSLNPSFPNFSISFKALAEPDFCLYDLHEPSSQSDLFFGSYQ
jgi:hypothetical protein